MNYPAKLQKLLELFSEVPDREIRAEMLIDYAKRFREVPARIAQRPFPEERRVKYCESEAYIWSEPQADGTLKFHFAVENPQGISAKAMAAILDETLSGAPVGQVAQISGEIAYQIFGRDLTMGKGMGLMSMVGTVQNEARRHMEVNQHTQHSVNIA
ncbi:MAG: SufE family protein [bacterium]